MMISSINILIIFIYFSSFVLINSSQQCSQHGKECNNNDKKCCRALNCKNARTPNTLFEFECLYGDCVKENKYCDDSQLCCYGYHCYVHKCKKCKLNGASCNGVVECCSGNSVVDTINGGHMCAAWNHP
uniref:Uncharacterized protein n=1 Tax=Meloidogyne floridensis TaxID=298350 RepID=A0A915P719_9BILA